MLSCARFETRRRTAPAPLLQAIGQQATSLHLYALALARRDWSPSPGDVYLDRPNILSYHRQIRLKAEGGVAFPTVTTSSRMKSPCATGRLVPSAVARLRQGVVDTNAEAILASQLCGMELDKSACGAVQNTAELLARDEHAGVEWLTIRGAQDGAWRGPLRCRRYEGAR